MLLRWEKECVYLYRPINVKKVLGLLSTKYICNYSVLQTHIQFYIQIQAWVGDGRKIKS